MEATADNNSLIDEQEVTEKPNFFKSFLFNKIPFLKTLPYPGKAEEIISEVKGLINDDIYEGGKVDFNFKISPFFDTTHSFNVYTPNENSRTPKYSNQYMFSKDSTLLYAKVDSERRILGRFDQAFYNNSIRVSLSNMMDKTLKSNLASELEFRFPFMNLCFKADSENTKGFSFITSITKKFTFGIEHTYLGNHGQSINQLQFFVNNPKSTFSFIMGNTGQIESSYVYRHKNLHIGTDLVMGITQEAKIMSEYSFGARYAFQQSLLKFRADSNGSIFGSYDQLINQITKINISASLNYFTQDYKFGLGLNLQK
ncbi:hypothetical protein RB653_003007 [Dictyostelium firmibasis]|uniref:Mitochondrial import receptor subunit TOM40 n=1 Tax=Dictyostelium firmibasis TaxID=79012 RepID=A0AAN7YQJ2_9MYCE